MIKIHLSKLLGERRMSQRELSKLTGIRYPTINEMYHELLPKISFEHMDKICEALNCKSGDLFEYVPNKVRTTGDSLILEEHGNRKSDLQ